MSEKVVIPPPEQIQPGIPPSVRTPSRESYLPFLADEDLIPSMACAGEGYHVHVTGLTHDEQGYPVITAAVHERLVRRLVDKIRLNAAKIIQTEAIGLEQAEVVVVAYGCTARAAREAVTGLSQAGEKVGLLRLITLWPFPEEQIQKNRPTGQGLYRPGNQLRPDGL